jgi:hypothetical protein
MNEMDYWKFTPHYTIKEAAALIVGADPVDVIMIENFHDTREFYIGSGFEASKNFQPVYTAIKRSLIDQSLICERREDFIIKPSNGGGTLQHGNAFSIPPQAFTQPDADIKLKGLSQDVCNTVAALTYGEIGRWLESKGINTGFFFPDSNINNVPDYLNKDHSCFALKLYAAIKAWEGSALDEENYGTPKQQMERWLVVRAVDFGLVHETTGANYNKGELKNSAIQEICSVANWNQEGGRSTKDTPKVNLSPKTASFSSDTPPLLDDSDNIPF